MIASRRCTRGFREMFLIRLTALILFALSLSLYSSSTLQAEEPRGTAPIDRWLKPQAWKRDAPGPVVALGAPGAFDDTHIFAPCIAFEDGRYRLWYCGSRGTVKKRIFRLGLASSRDQRTFEKHHGAEGGGAVYEFGDGKHSVLTPTLLRHVDGTPLREGGKLRMWFSATHFEGASGLHTLHETTSTDGIRWSAPSPPLLEHVYSPTVIRDGATYRMWYADVSREPWILRHAQSRDGRRWQVTDGAILGIDQAWERTRLFYPTVVQTDGVYLLWYGSYWAGESAKTAIGFAVSTDGLQWRKNPHNPVLTPDPDRPWESHYTTSQSVVRLEDGSWRMWFATRKKPPFVNKYFALSTARWDGLKASKDLSRPSSPK